MSVVHYNSGVFYAWIDGVLTTIPIGSGGTSPIGGLNSPLAIDGLDGDDSFPYFNSFILSKIPAVTFTTTGNIDDLDFGNSPLIRMDNASDSTIRGLKAGYDGQIVTLVSIGAGHVYLAHQNTSSSVNNRLINNVISSNTPLAAGTGIARFQYDGITLKWRLIHHEQGAWITPTFNASNFFGSGAMTWDVDSGDVQSYSSHLSGVTLSMLFAFTTTSIGGTPTNELKLQIPGGFTSVLSSVLAAIRSYDNGVDTVGFCGSGIGFTYLRLWRGAFANWTISTNNTSVQGRASFVVN